MSDTQQRIDTLVKTHPIVLFMKGTALFPMCGFSSRAVQALKAAGATEFSHLSLEGYINAKVVAEGLRRAGKNLTRESLIASMQGIRSLDLGGMEVGFGKGGTSASRFVELTVINSQGRLVK